MAFANYLIFYLLSTVNILMTSPEQGHSSPDDVPMHKLKHTNLLRPPDAEPESDCQSCEEGNSGLSQGQVLPCLRLHAQLFTFPI